MPHSETEAERIARLEAELARVKTERDLYKESVAAILREQIDDDPMTEEEALALIRNPPSHTLDEIIAEFKQQLSAS